MTRVLSLATVLLVVASSAAAAAITTTVAYEWPVDGPVVEPFREPDGPYGSGHRGVDLVITAHEQVRSMAEGTVVFSGLVAGETWVTVEHPDAIRTSYGPLVSGSNVSEGTQLRRGQPLGAADGHTPGHEGRLHVGARLNGRYIDPARLVAPGLPTLTGPTQLGWTAPHRAGYSAVCGPLTWRVVFASPDAENHQIHTPC